LKKLSKKLINYWLYYQKKNYDYSIEKIEVNSHFEFEINMAEEGGLL